MLRYAGRRIIEKSQQLSELDMIGDADFGVNVSSGFEKIDSKLSALRNPDIGSILTTAGQVFVLDIGSTMGGLIGRAFQKAGQQLQGDRTLDVHKLAKLLETMFQTIQEVGGGRLGDKTLLDALYPASRAAIDAVKSGTASVRRVLQIAASAAEEGAKSTAGMVARTGRASYLGERSRGGVDPGAMFIYFFLDGMAESLCD
jgi:dihydroxyacetone kinase-like protein